MVSLPEPPAPDRPLFVYGLLKPRELAYSLINEYVSEVAPGTIRGCLRLRDGLPLFDSAGRGEVSGCLLHFYPLRSQEAWEAVANFVLSKHYKYATADIIITSQAVKANVLVGRQIRKGAALEVVDCWSAWCWIAQAAARTCTCAAWWVRARDCLEPAGNTRPSSEVSRTLCRT